MGFSTSSAPGSPSHARFVLRWMQRTFSASCDLAPVVHHDLPHASTERAPHGDPHQLHLVARTRERRRTLDRGLAGLRGERLVERLAGQARPRRPRNGGASAPPRRARPRPLPLRPPPRAARRHRRRAASRRPPSGGSPRGRRANPRPRRARRARRASMTSVGPSVVSEARPFAGAAQRSANATSRAPCAPTTGGRHRRCRAPAPGWTGARTHTDGWRRCPPSPAPRRRRAPGTCRRRASGRETT